MISKASFGFLTNMHIVFCKRLSQVTEKKFTRSRNQKVESRNFMRQPKDSSFIATFSGCCLSSSGGCAVWPAEGACGAVQGGGRPGGLPRGAPLGRLCSAERASHMWWYRHQQPARHHRQSLSARVSHQDETLLFSLDYNIFIVDFSLAVYYILRLI